MLLGLSHVKQLLSLFIMSIIRLIVAKKMYEILLLLICRRDLINVFFAIPQEAALAPCRHRLRFQSTSSQDLRYNTARSYLQALIFRRKHLSMMLCLAIDVIILFPFRVSWNTSKSKLFPLYPICFLFQEYNMI